MFNLCALILKAVNDFLYSFYLILNTFPSQMYSLSACIFLISTFFHQALFAVPKIVHIFPSICFI